MEFEFLRVVEDIKLKKPTFVVLHGPAMRSGNTIGDLGKTAVEPFKQNKEPVIILQEHIVVNDMRLIDILKRYDLENQLSVSPEQFIAALDVSVHSFHPSCLYLFVMKTRNILSCYHAIINRTFFVATFKQ